MPAERHRSEFIRRLRLEIPESIGALKGYRDSLTMEMLAFKVMTQEAIGRGDLALVRRCFLFAGSVLAEGNRQVRNSLAVTFLEHLDFSGRHGEKAEKLLTSPLRRERAAVLAYLDELLQLARESRGAYPGSGSSPRILRR